MGKGDRRYGRRCDSTLRDYCEGDEINEARTRCDGPAGADVQTNACIERRVIEVKYHYVKTEGAGYHI